MLINPSDYQVAGYTAVLTNSISSSDVLRVFVSNVELAPTTTESYIVLSNAQSQTSTISFAAAPRAGAKISALLTNLNYGFDYNIEPGDVIFLPNSQPGDVIKVITFTEDLSYGWVTETFSGNASGTYQLADVASDTNSVMVFVDGKMQSLLWDYLCNTATVPTATISNVYTTANSVTVSTYGNVSQLEPGMMVSGNSIPRGTYINAVVVGSPSTITLSQPALETDQITMTAQTTASVIQFNQQSAPASNSNVVVTYATGQINQPPIAWRTLTDNNGKTTSIAVDDSRKTKVLSDVYVYTNEIEIADMTAIGSAPGSVWIDDELISYARTQPSPTVQYPNRGFISELRRAVGNTSDSPTAVYDTLYYNGDGTTRYFPAASGTMPLAETVYVNGKVQTSISVDPVNGTYESTSNNLPSGLPAGRYIAFTAGNAPSIGWRNVRIVALNTDAASANPVHGMDAEVIDAGNSVRMPNGYAWEPTPLGLQYSGSEQSKFLLQHSGTRS